MCEDGRSLLRVFAGYGGAASQPASDVGSEGLSLGASGALLIWTSQASQPAVRSILSSGGTRRERLERIGGNRQLAIGSWSLVGQLPITIMGVSSSRAWLFQKQLIRLVTSPAAMSARDRQVIAQFIRPLHLYARWCSVPSWVGLIETGRCRIFLAVQIR